MKNVALITGASTGIGKQFAIIHAQNKGDLVIVARSLDKLQVLKSELESKYAVKVKVIAKDLTQNTAAQEIHDEIKKEGIELDYLINNAGFGGQGFFHERKLEDDITMINLNIVALTKLTRLFLPELIQGGRAKILNVSSTASLMPGPLQAVYFATKAYVTSFNNALSRELKGTGVTVTNLMPGATDTEFAKVADLENTDLFKKAYSAYDVALAGYKAMQKRKMDVIAGVPFSQQMLMKLMAFAPKKMILDFVYNLQKK